MRELALENCRLDRRYDVERELGRGSYAEIFVAHDRMASPSSPHSCVVIKALNVFLQDDLDPDLERTLVENFQNEAVALDRVRHPNIISRLGHGTARDLKGTVFHYLVLEYLEGGDLQKAQRAHPVSFKQTFKYIEQVCAGLRHAHRHNIIHRDIKPQNLLLTKDRETVKIADFGVARIHLSDSPITRVGTNIYAPPEHSPLNFDESGHMTVATLTPAADVYSLAKSVYTLITGEAPRAFANKQITDLPLTWRDKEWSDDLLRVLKRATASDPSARQQSIDEFWHDLEPVRKIAFDIETATSVRPKLHETPQAHVSRGYSPLAPQQPRFDTSRELKLKDAGVPSRVTDFPAMPGRSSGAVSDPGGSESNHPDRRSGGHPSFSKEGSFGDSRSDYPDRSGSESNHPDRRSGDRSVISDLGFRNSDLRGAAIGYEIPNPKSEIPNRTGVAAASADGVVHAPNAPSRGYFPNQNPLTVPVDGHVGEDEIQNLKSKIQNRGLRRIVTFAVLLIIFAGGLYGTSAFLRSRGIIPSIGSAFGDKTGRANTDINLRPEPNANNDPIGLVTKNSRVKIIRTQNNWYQVDVLEQGRDRDTPLSTNRGWLNGKYVDLD